MKILVADDVMFIRKMLTDKLLKSGHEVIEACNGEEALRKALNEQPDIVFIE